MKLFIFKAIDNSQNVVDVASTLEKAVENLFGIGADCTFVKADWEVFSANAEKLL